jgi:hypothetical protein
MTAFSTHEKGTITSQLVTANKNLDPTKMKCDLKSESKLAFGNFTFTDKPVQQAILKVTNVFLHTHVYNNFNFWNTLSMSRVIVSSLH